MIIRLRPPIPSKRLTYRALPELRVSGRTELFSGDYYYQPSTARTVYDYDRANDRFLMVDRSGGDEPNSPRINVILNWFEELKQRVPTGGSQ